jgi:hypothetical protein
LSSSLISLSISFALGFWVAELGPPAIIVGATFGLVTIFYGAVPGKG